MRRFRREDKERFFYFCVLLFFIGFAIVSIVWSSKSYYSNAYRPVVEEANTRHEIERRRAESRMDGREPSAQPRAPGFSEAEIEKSRGDRYAAY